MLKNTLYICLLVLYAICNNAVAQELYNFSLSKKNGLPSNNIYYATVDHLGYLWICTDKGVVKYNGYNVTDFNLSENFGCKDIWFLREDNKGRMWLFSISDRLGFIRNNVYHNTHFFGRNGLFYLSSSTTADHSNGVAFFGVTGHDSFKTRNFIVEKNDTLHSHELRITKGIDSKYALCRILSESKAIIYSSNDSAYLLDISGGQSIAKPIGKINYANEYEWNQDAVLKLLRLKNFNFGRYIFAINDESDQFNLIDTKTHILYKKTLNSITHCSEKETILNINISGPNISIVTELKAYTIDTNLSLLSVVDLNSINGAPQNKKINYFRNDPFWGKLIGIQNKGLLLPTNSVKTLKKENPIELDNYLYLGKLSDSVGFWWNNTTQTIVKINNRLNANYSQITVHNATKIIPYKKDTALLLSNSGLYRLNTTTLEAELFPISNRTQEIVNTSAYDGVLVDSNIIYSLSKGMGFYSFELKEQTGWSKKITDERFKGLQIDRGHKQFWLHYYNKLFIYNINGYAKSYGIDSLQKRGINSIDNVYIDQKYGNIFIQEEKRLLLLQSIDKPFIQLFENFILKDAIVAVDDDRLIIAGGFGVIICKINALGKITSPIYYRNTKNAYYNSVSDLMVLKNIVLLKTDNGAYKVDLPDDDSQFKTTEPELKYKLICYNADSSMAIKHGDTIFVTSNNQNLLLDVINPLGDGIVRYRYKLNKTDTLWHEMDGGNLVLPNIVPGIFYKLSVIVFDNQWQSNEIVLHVYLTPKWWETPKAKIVTWLAVLLLGISIVYFIFYFAKYRAAQKNAKINRQIELELKSVYAQINPHFIFNSLSAALYLVKLKKVEEAYQHIYKFSHLLRSYIKSSRNRFISIEDEVNNLRAYIELQQVRFNNKFEYTINISTALDRFTKLPSLLIQPLVENAITHGLLHKETKGLLKIEFTELINDKGIECTIEDNGIGRKKSRLIKDENQIKEESYGTDLTKDLINILNKYEQIEIKMTYIDKVEPDMGTIVKLSIKDYRK